MGLVEDKSFKRHFQSTLSSTNNTGIRIILRWLQIDKPHILLRFVNGLPV